MPARVVVKAVAVLVTDAVTEVVTEVVTETVEDVTVVRNIVLLLNLFDKKYK